MAEPQYQSVPLTPLEKNRWLADLDFEDDDRLPPPKTRTRNLFQSPWIWLVHAALLSTSLALLAISLCLNTGAHHPLEGFQSVSPNSPVSSAIKYEVKEAPVGSSWRESPYVGQGREVDDAWSSITNTGDFIITDREREKLGLPSHSQRVVNLVTGEWGYRASVQVFDQLRCLNLLRQSAHRAQGEHTENTDSINECVELLRETLMCHSDVGITTFKPSIDVAEGPQTFERQGAAQDRRMCRNFEEIRRWSIDRIVV